MAYERIECKDCGNIDEYLLVGNYACTKCGSTNIIISFWKPKE